MNASTTTTDARDRAELEQAMGLLSDALSSCAAGQPSAALRTQLAGRVADSARRHRALHTRRRRQRETVTVGAGIERSLLYAAAAPTRRPGEAESIALVELAPGTQAVAALGLAGHDSEWLVLRGDLSVDGTVLGALDHLVREAAPDEPLLASREGALVYLRDSGSAGGAPLHGLSRAAGAQWKDFVPGIQRRVLWRHGATVAYLARAADGAAVPAHGHRQDEECLMLEGDLFTGDVLLREGDFQLAPAGFDHDVVQAGSDCLVYVRGDADPPILG